MEQLAHLWLFFAVVLGVVILPGMDMAFVMASGLTGGARSGLSAVAGIVAGGVCHVVMGALGFAVVLRLVPGLFNAVLLAGALYIAWIGISLYRGGATLGEVADGGPRSRLAIFRRGAVTSLLNPKAYLFMLAIFPQFLKPEYGDIAVQALVLGLIITATQVLVYGPIALAAGRARTWLAGNTTAGVRLGRAIGLLLVAAAAYTGWQGWQAA